MLTGLRNVLIDGVASRIVVDGKKIFHVRKDEGPLTADVTWVDGKRCEALPSTIGVHEHDRWGESHKEDPRHLEAASFAGGMGTITVMPNTVPAFIRVDQTEDRLKGFAHSKLTVRAWGGTTRTNFAERRQMLQSYGHVIVGFKLAMASTTNPETLIDDLPSQRRVLEENAELKAVTAVHAEAEDWINLSRAEIQRQIGQAILGIHHHCKVRAGEVEVEGIRRILQAHWEIRSPAPIHICHLSTLGGLEIIKRARERGQKVTCETCPHYWVFNEQQLFGIGAGYYKMNPALRPQKEQLGILEGLCNGEIDMVSTDHAPHGDEKTNEELDKCPSGVPGVQTLTLLLYSLYRQGRITRKRYIELSSENPAKLLGLKKGKLEIGSDADIVLIDPHKVTLFTDDSMLYKCGWTPYHNMTANGKIRFLMLGGEIVKNNL